MKPGPKPRTIIKTDWSASFAYSIGLLVADGCLSKDGRHISFVSKDKDLVEIFKAILGLSAVIGTTRSGAGNEAYRVQFGSVHFYNFLLRIGLMPAKSKIISAVAVPRAYFADYLRGYFDGDGTSFSYMDPLFPRSIRFYVSFTSGSISYLEWLRLTLAELFEVGGYISRNRNNAYPQLRYSKKEAVILCQKMYYTEGLPCLKRKQDKARGSLEKICSSRSGEIGRRAVFRTQ